jgi:hypothetical protein
MSIGIGNENEDLVYDMHLNKVNRLTVTNIMAKRSATATINENSNN